MATPNDTRSHEEINLPAEENGQAPQTALDWLYWRVPAFDSLRTYSLLSLRLDLFAGLTVAAVAVPQAMAYASIAQLPVQYGLYTAIIMTVVGALFDSSKQLINGPTNAICIALASAIAFIPVNDSVQRAQAAILMAFLVGAIQTCITLFRLGDLTRFVSHSVIVGFTLGAAILLALGQLRNFLGLPRGGANDDHFLVRFYMTMSRLDLVNFRAVGIGTATIILAVGLRRFGGRLRSQLPDFLIVVALMAALVGLLGWDAGNQATANEATVAGKVLVIGTIPFGLPSLEARRAGAGR